MDVRPQLEPASSAHALSVAFNSARTCFSVGLSNGFCIYHTKSCLLKGSRDFNAGIGLAQMMDSTNYIALVGGGRQPKFSNNKAIIWDDMRGKVAMEISSLTPVRGVKISRQYIVVVLQNRVSVYGFQKSKPLIAEYETYNNPLGLCSLSDDHLAFPGRRAGHVYLVGLKANTVSIIPAHSSALRDIQFSPDGQMIATASETGTLIRVYTTNNGARVAELRRGIDPARIFSIAFSPSGNFLACTSDKATLHVFDIQHPNKPPFPPKSPSSPRSNGQGDMTSSYSSASDYIAPSASIIPPSSSTSILPSSSGDGNGKGKWGILSKLPLMPRAFSDTYSFAQANFSVGDDSMTGSMPVSELTTLGTSRPQKGIIGWISDESIVVIGAGNDARWEKFSLCVGQDGKRMLMKDNWKKYLGSG